jgi:hypothetical protein
MATKRPSLAESMKQAATPEPEPKPVAPSPPAQIASKPAIAAAPPNAGKGFYAATRAGKKKVTAALDPAKHKQLKGLAVQLDTTTEALLSEAIEDLFQKHANAVH